MNDDANVLDSAYRLIAIDRPREALELLSRNFDAQDSWSWHARAAALAALDRYQEAAEAAEAGLMLDPEQPRLFDALAAARMGLEDFAGAEKAILSGLQLDAEDAGMLARYAHIVACAGQIAKAEKLVARALAVDPENTFALQMHAFLATARADRRETVARSRELLRHVPEHPVGHRLLASVHFEEGRIDAARDHLATAARSDPTDDVVAEVARDVRARSHWLLWPLRPVMRWGAAPLWVAVIATMFLFRALKLDTPLIALSLFWLAYCVYSWVVPPIVRRLARRL